MNDPPSRTTFHDYLTREAAADARHEFLDGFVYAMSGPSKRHGRIVRDATHALNRRLAGSGCEAFSDPLDLANDWENFVRVPRVIVEVSSPSTQGFDRGDKFAAYGELASLAEYVLVDTRRRRVEMFRRAGDAWHLHVAVAGEVALASLEASLALDEIYAGVRFEPGPVSPLILETSARA